MSKERDKIDWKAHEKQTDLSECYEDHNVPGYIYYRRYEDDTVAFVISKRAIEMIRTKEEK